MPSSSASMPDAKPASTCRPPKAMQRKVRVVISPPMVSNATSTPRPPVASSAASTKSVALVSIATSAPSCAQKCAFSADPAGRDHRGAGGARRAGPPRTRRRRRPRGSAPSRPRAAGPHVERQRSRGGTASGSPPRRGAGSRRASGTSSTPAPPSTRRSRRTRRSGWRPRVCRRARRRRRHRRLDRAERLHARDVRRGDRHRRVAAVDAVDVVEVERDRVGAHEHLARSGRGDVDSSRRRTSRGVPCSTARQARTAVLRGGVERERQVRQSAHVAGVRALHRLPQLVVRVALQQLLERDARLEPRQRGTDTQVDAEAEPDVAFDVRGGCRSTRGRRTPARRGWPHR